MTQMWEMIPLIVMFVMIAVVVKYILDYKTRTKLIDKGMVDENVKYLYADRPESQILSSLKWGMMLIGVGAAVLIGQLAPPDLVEEYTIGGMFILAGLGLCLYYLIANHKMRKSREKGLEA
jgi:asparagine N-glycosylation enzyme membrane subunit Stt3